MAQGRNEERAPGAGLLANPSRARLFQSLLDHPLLHVAALARAAAVARPSARWHLHVLEEAGLVRCTKGAREARYFVTGTVDDSLQGALMALRAPLGASALAAVVEAPGLSLRELADALDASSQATLRATRQLEAVGFVEAVRDGKFVRHYPGPHLETFRARRAAGLPGQLLRVETALAEAGEHVAVTRRSRDEVQFQVGRRGARREFRFRPDMALGEAPHS
jgi:DNA-binding transcriptional ArsR family regulator